MAHIKFNTKFVLLIVVLMNLGIFLVGCAQPAAEEMAAEEPAATEEKATEEPAATEEVVIEEPQLLEGDVVVDGSSTVFPITSAVAEEFALVQPNVRVSVGLSGTGGGFKKFCPGETDINDASRRIKDEEKALCEENGVEYTEFLVALDGLTVMVNPENDWLESLTVEQLAQLLVADSTITKWSDIDPSFPDEEILFFIPDPDSGTRDYMEEVIAKALGLEKTDLRQDENTTFSSDDNVLLDGIANEKYAFGFFGYAYYVSQKDKVRAVAIVNKDGEAVLPSDETVQDGSYNPLSRPLFIYVNNESLRTKPQVAEFVRFYMSEAGAQAIMASVGYSLPPEGTFEANLALLEAVLAGQ